MFTSKIKKITIASLTIIVTAGLAIFGAGQSGLFKGSIIELNREGSNTISYVPGSLEFSLVGVTPATVSLEINSNTNNVSCLIRNTEEELQTGLNLIDVDEVTPPSDTIEITGANKSTFDFEISTTDKTSKFIGCRSLESITDNENLFTNTIFIGINNSTQKYIIQEAPKSIISSNHQAAEILDTTLIPLTLTDGSEFKVHSNIDEFQLRIKNIALNDELAAYKITNTTPEEKTTTIIWDGKTCKDLSISFENYTANSNLDCPKGEYQIIFFDSFNFLGTLPSTKLLIEPEVITPVKSSTITELTTDPAARSFTWEPYPVSSTQTVSYDVTVKEYNDFSATSSSFTTFRTENVTSSNYTIPDSTRLSNGKFQIEIAAKITNNPGSSQTIEYFYFEPRQFERNLPVTATTITPSEATPGQTVTITGTNFDRLYSTEGNGTSRKNFIKVKFAGSAPTNELKLEVTPSTVTSTSITATIPNDAITGRITIGKPGTPDYDVTTSTPLTISTSNYPTSRISINSLEITGTTVKGKLNARTMPIACYFNTQADRFSAETISTQMSSVTPAGTRKTWTGIYPYTPSNSNFELTNLPVGNSNTLVICEYEGDRREYTTFSVNTIAPTSLITTPASNTTTSATGTQFTWTKAPANQNGMAFGAYYINVEQGNGAVSTTVAVSNIDTLTTTIRDLSLNTNYRYEIIATYFNTATGRVDLYLTNPQTISFNTGIAPTNTLTITNTTTPTIASNQVPANTTSVTFNPVTNLAATCQYRNTLTQSAYTNITTTGVTSHPFNLTGLTNNTSYNIEIKCTGTGSNSNLVQTITVPFGVGVAYNGPVNLVDITATNIATIGSIVPIQVSFPSTNPIDFSYLQFINKDDNKAVDVIIMSCNQSSAITDIKTYCTNNKLNSAAITGPSTRTVNWNTARVASSLDPEDYIIRAVVYTSTGANEFENREIEFTGRGSAEDRLLPEESCEEYFDDMDDRDDLCEEIAYLREEGIFLGQEVGRGRREANLNARLLRSEYFALASRLDGGGRSSVDESFLRGFRDLTPAIINDSRNDWWLEAVSSLRGIVRGYDDGTLRPTATATQAELAKVAAETVISGFENDDNQNPWFSDTVDLYDSYGFRLSPMSTATRADAVEILYTTLLIEEGLLDDEYDDRYDSRTSNGRSYRR